MISLKSAPRWLSIAYALHGALFCLPTLMLFYSFKGLGMGDFFLIQGISQLSIFILEIPTGYIGDLFSRKSTLIIGTLAWIVGHLIWIFNFLYISNQQNSSVAKNIQFFRNQLYVIAVHFVLLKKVA